MSLLDDLMKQGGGLGSLAAKNPQIVAALIALLSSRDSSVGGSGGLGGLIDVFQKKGLGETIGSWISTGPNPPLSADQVEDALGGDVLAQFARKAGVPPAEAGGILASLLPSLVDQLTPEGAVPEEDTFESALGGLFGGLTR